MQSYRAGKSRARRTRRRLTHRLWLFIIYTAQDHVNDCWALHVLFGSLCSVHHRLSFNSALSPMEYGLLSVMFDALDLKGKSVVLFCFWTCGWLLLTKRPLHSRWIAQNSTQKSASSVLPTWKRQRFHSVFILHRFMNQSASFTDEKQRSKRGKVVMKNHRRSYYEL